MRNRPFEAPNTSLSCVQNILVRAHAQTTHAVKAGLEPQQAKLVQYYTRLENRPLPKEWHKAEHVMSYLGQFVKSNQN